MKKVRFETQKSAEYFGMSDSECHSPRPFIGERMRSTLDETCYELPRVLPYSNDPVHRFDNSNSSPYPKVVKIKTGFPDPDPGWKPSEDLDLSFLDASCHEPRLPFSKMGLTSSIVNGMCSNPINTVPKAKPVLASTENIQTPPPNVLVKDNSFFIRRENLDKYMNINPIQQQFKTLGLGKENNPLARKAEMVYNGNFQRLPAETCLIEPTLKPILKSDVYQNKLPKLAKSVVDDHCQCHHCVKTIGNLQNDTHRHNIVHNHGIPNPGYTQCHCSHQPKACTHCYQETQPIQTISKTCDCQSLSPTPQNAVDKKTLAIEKFEQRKQPKCLEVEKQTNISKEKREPTVADLFKIIKLQNEQLQMLQDKVDKFISQQNQPTISCSTEHVSTVENEQVKMSIGVMTSFEMVRTSTVINKEIIKTNDNSQIQCNRSQISIKEVVAKPSTNFLDGIAPVNNPPNCSNTVNNDEKTLNELSLYNVQVDATTPNLSPEQTLYLDVRDYSDSEASCNDQSNVGWTYYNKVMTHVNGMLQDSEMPSSASAMFRNMRQQCVQMQIDKSNISVTKRVKFGDDPLGIHQPHIYATDTSLKMNQLAAKYLKNSTQAQSERTAAARPSAPIDMSFATRNYMERHKILQGVPSNTTPAEIPRFLDITALKQQPKFL